MADVIEGELRQGLSATPRLPSLANRVKSVTENSFEKIIKSQLVIKLGCQAGPKIVTGLKCPENRGGFSFQ